MKFSEFDSILNNRVFALASVLSESLVDCIKGKILYVMLHNDGKIDDSLIETLITKEIEK